MGCTDETATNYNSLANVDDGSCEYEGDAIDGVPFNFTVTNYGDDSVGTISNDNTFDE